MTTRAEKVYRAAEELGATSVHLGGKCFYISLGELEQLVLFRSCSTGYIESLVKDEVEKLKKRKESPETSSEKTPEKKYKLRQGVSWEKVKEILDNSAEMMRKVKKYDNFRKFHDLFEEDKR